MVEGGDECKAQGEDAKGLKIFGKHFNKQHPHFLT